VASLRDTSGHLDCTKLMLHADTVTDITDTERGKGRRL
jgi:hypothetical protein